MSAVRSCYRPPKRRPHVICSMGSFFLPFSFFLYNHITSCIRDSLHFVRRFAPSKCVRCGTSSILLSPTIRKHHVIRSVGFFIAISLFPLQSYNLLHPRLTTFCASLCSFKMCSLRNQFDPVIAHHKKASRDPLRGAFFLPFSFFLYSHITSCIRDSLHFALASLLQNVFAAEPVRSCYRPP